VYVIVLEAMFKGIQGEGRQKSKQNFIILLFYYLLLLLLLPAMH